MRHRNVHPGEAAFAIGPFHGPRRAAVAQAAKRGLQERRAADVAGGDEPAESEGGGTALIDGGHHGAIDGIVAGDGDRSRRAGGGAGDRFGAISGIEEPDVGDLKIQRRDRKDEPREGYEARILVGRGGKAECAEGGEPVRNR